MNEPNYREMRRKAQSELNEIWAEFADSIAGQPSCEEVKKSIKESMLPVVPVDWNRELKDLIKESD